MNPLLNMVQKQFESKPALKLHIVFCHTDNFDFDVGKSVHLLLHVFWILYLTYEGLHAKVIKILSLSLYF